MQRIYVHQFDAARRSEGRRNRVAALEDNRPSTGARSFGREGIFPWVTEVATED
jgi:hypothetical protein